MTDPSVPSPEQREAELRAAGWNVAWIWTNPEGLELGPSYTCVTSQPGGRCVMLAERDTP